MQTTSDTKKETGASPNPTDRQTGGAAATELGRHYGEHGHAATANAGPSAQGSGGNVGIGEQTRSAAAAGAEAARDMAIRAGETAQDMANRAGEQARPAIAKITEPAQDLASRAREQAAPAAQAVYDQSARAGQYVARNVHEYPATALLFAAAVGYGLAYLIHGGGRSLRWGRHHNRYDEGAH
jgi:ElaB/YqjD/DUF883 family membrane-anchored ribosome-binding protein